MKFKRYKIRVNGLVQGVGFRYYTLRIAEQFGATGFVRNNMDGSVSTEVQIRSDLVNQLIEEIRRGPSHSYVREFQKVEIDIIENEKEFVILR